MQESVLRATEELLAGGTSWSDLGVERIATAAGLSRTAFYFYFRDKRDLLVHLTEDVVAQLYAEAEGWFAGDGDPVEEIPRALRQIAALYQEHGALLRVIVEVATYDEDAGAFWRAVVARFVDATCLRIEAEQAAGRVPATLAAHPTAYNLVWMGERTLYQLHVSEPLPFSADEAVEALIAVWLRALYGAGV